MKKLFISLLLSIVLLFGITAVCEASTISISGDTVSSYPGESVSVRFTTSGINDSNKLGAFQANLGNLPSGIKCNSINSSVGDSQNGAVSWMESNPVSGGYTSNVTVTLSLTIDSSVNPGDYSIPMSFSCQDMDESDMFDGLKYATVKVIENVQEQPASNEQPAEQEETPAQKPTENNNSKPKSGDAELASLTAQVNGKSLDVSRNGSKSSATVESDVTAVTFTVKANSSVASIDSNKSTSGLGFVKNSGSGAQKTYTMSNLQEGNNVIKITITAEDGTQRNYTFTVTKKVAENKEEIPDVPNIVEEETNNDEQKEEEETTDNTFGLKTLVITGVEISPEFNVNTYEYTATIEGSDSVEVIAIATDEEAEVEIVGNTNLVAGENLITIVVKKGEEIKTYQIILDKTESALTTTGTSDDGDLFLGLTWKHLSIIIAAILIILAIVIKLVFLSKSPIDNHYDDVEYEEDDKDSNRNQSSKNDNIYYNEESSKKGKRFK